MTSTIAKLNDQFRRTFQGGRVMLTASLAALDPVEQAAIFAKVRAFDIFTEDNDPYGEHDFGAFTYGGKRFFWKIDYYAPDMQHGSENPADPSRTVRVLTVMLAEEY